MADNNIIKTIKDAEIDARSLSEFVYKPSNIMVTRRLAPSIHSLQYYLDFLDSIPGIVQSAIDSASVPGGLIADTFVTVDNATTQRTINRGLESISALLTIDNATDGLRVYVKSFYANSNRGGGFFVYSSNTSKQDADGCQVIDSSTTGGFDGSSGTLEGYLTAQGSGVGNGCWVKETEEFLCPYAFGYDDNYLTGLLSIYSIIDYAKRQGHGHLKIPEGQDFYLGSNAKNPNSLTPYLYEFGDNFSWYIPSNSRLLINGHVPIWHQPSGYGHSGGTKNFKLYGGGIIEGASLDPVDYCFFSMNFIHTTNIKCYDITFINAANGHVFDLMGCKDIHIKGCKFIGSTMDFQSGRNGNEVIQISAVTAGGRADQVAKYNQYMDYTQCSDILIEDCRFEAYRDKDTGEIITYSQKAIGDHGFSFDAIDNLVLKNLYIEQTDPSARISKFNNAMVVIPNVTNLLIDNVYLKMLGDMSYAINDVAQIGVLSVTSKNYTTTVEKPTEPTRLPPAISKPRPPSHVEGKHIVKRLTIDASEVADIDFGRAYVTKRSTYMEDFNYIGNLSEGARGGMDVFTFNRDGVKDQLGGTSGVELSPTLQVKGLNIKYAKNIIYLPAGGCYLHFENAHIEGGQWGISYYTQIPERLTMNNVTHVPTKYGRHSNSWISANIINMTNCTLLDAVDEGVILTTSNNSPKGFCINSTLSKASRMISNWESSDGMIMSGVVDLSS